MEKKRFKFVIPVMVIVAIGSVYMLTNYYAEVPDLNQLLITICATLISGVLAYFSRNMASDESIPTKGQPLWPLFS
ncbi:Acyltransferase OS=Lysinibacillus sphaericus OX=1421 GN=LS41612_00935 PE=4 SV=1 [Lysinibacillus sphaericus]